MLHRRPHPFVSLVLVSLCLENQAVAFESTKVLPKGVRSFNLRIVDTLIDQKTNSEGKALPLADPLSQDLTFKKIADGEETIKGNLLRAFLLSEGFDINSAVGSFDADLKARVRVSAPILAYGIHEKVTIALAVPYYRASTKVAIGFKPNGQAQAFLSALSRPENNQVAAAREAGEKLNQAVTRLNDKLLDNGFASLGPWEQEGLGDITLAAKTLVAQGRLGENRVAFATTGGLVAPTGRVDDPNILTDIPFGDGQWDAFGQLSFDEEIVEGVTLNQSLKYTHQFQGQKKVRAVLEEEKIEVPVVSTQFKPGDKWETNLSLQWQPSFGLVSGIGYHTMTKWGDRYNLPSASTSPETARELEKNTDQSLKAAEATLGWSTVPAFQRGSVPIPLELKFTINRPLASENTPVSSLTQLDFTMFF
jgi:hypothetical protein